MKKLTSRQIKAFQKRVWDYYTKERRRLPWRTKHTPYYVVISEIMLQQTQVSRALVKFPEFIQKFPDFKTLAKASTRDVLTVWQGLGYNRRALALKKIAERVTGECGGRLPKDLATLESFPSIGPATASSIRAFVFNTPTVFIETNIRTVFIHEFFRNHGQIHDTELTPLIEQTLDRKKPREWYWALMDYGTMLKGKHPNPSRKSFHYTKQTPFKESNRYIRGQVIKLLTENKSLTSQQMFSKIDREEGRIKTTLIQLEDEGFITKKKQTYSLVG